MTVRSGVKDMNRGGSIRQMDREDYRYLIFLALIVCVCLRQLQEDKSEGGERQRDSTHHLDASTQTVTPSKTNPQLSRVQTHLLHACPGAHEQAGYTHPRRERTPTGAASKTHLFS